jgi:hypothetical protein
MALMSADRHNATRPDGYMLVKDRLQERTVSWADVLLLCEYKRLYIVVLCFSIDSSFEKNWADRIDTYVYIF